MLTDLIVPIISRIFIFIQTIPFLSEINCLMIQFLNEKKRLVVVIPDITYDEFNYSQFIFFFFFSDLLT